MLGVDCQIHARTVGFGNFGFAEFSAKPELTGALKAEMYFSDRLLMKAPHSF
jgi:hypothetical protein